MTFRSLFNQSPKKLFNLQSKPPFTITKRYTVLDTEIIVINSFHRSVQNLVLKSLIVVVEVCVTISKRDQLCVLYYFIVSKIKLYTQGRSMTLSSSISPKSSSLSSLFQFLPICRTQNLSSLLTLYRFSISKCIEFFLGPVLFLVFVFDWSLFELFSTLLQFCSFNVVNFLWIFFFLFT